ncbi:MAG: site-specific integrase, partial [bacterium]|nr:site-specific integrase [bacterium]
HTLRKTFGYHFYQKTKDVALLQQLFNHSAPSVTLRYIGINQDIMDMAIEDFSL